MVSDDDCGGGEGAVKHDGSIERQMDATEPTLKFNSEDIISRGIEQWIEATLAPPASSVIAQTGRKERDSKKTLIDLHNATGSEWTHARKYHDQFCVKLSREDMDDISDQLER